MAKDRTLYVVCCVSNPFRYQSRYKLYREFAKRMEETPGVRLLTVEKGFADRPFEVTDPENRWHVQVRGGPATVVWDKEALINIGFRHLTGQADRWSFAAWIDADIEFKRPNWVEETVYALEHFRIVQPWGQQIDLGPEFQAMGRSESFAKSYWDNESALAATGYPSKPINGVYRYHPGYAWAIRRETYEKLGGLMDWWPMGSGDYVMAWSFVEDRERAIREHTTPGIARRIDAFIAKCTEHLKKDVGYVDGLIEHHFHGSKRTRFYVEREKALRACNYDPDKDLMFNHVGLPMLTGKNIALRDTIRRYFLSRLEDSNTPG